MYSHEESNISNHGVYKKRPSVDSEVLRQNVKTFHQNGDSCSKSKPTEDFDGLLKLVGSQGKYQKTLLYAVLCPITALMPLAVLNVLFMLSEPDHWCRVEGRDNGTSLEAWKNMTIPREIGPDGQERFSQCLMFDTSVNNGSKTSIACNNGWEYDKTNYQATLSTDFDWVCDKSNYVTEAFLAAAVGSAVGTIIFGWAGDRFGRKIVFFLTCFANLAARLVSIYVPGYFYAFLAMQFLNGSSFPMLYIALFTIAAEISDTEYRAWIYGANWVIWVLGLCFLPLLAWLCSNWYVLGILTSAPGFLVFLYYKMIPESPRWLLSKNRLDEAEKVLVKISEANGTAKNLQKTEIAAYLLRIKNKPEEADRKYNGVWTLFTRKRVAMNTILLSIVWSVNGMIYYGISLNTTSMAGNQFLNFFILAIIELPSGWIGEVLAGKMGRRWTQVLFLFMCLIGFTLAVVGTEMPHIPGLIISSVVIAKFGVAVSSLIVNIQGMEIFPTELRSTGTGFACSVSSIFSILSPVIVYLGKIHASIPYAGMAGISAIGVIMASFLPETLKQILPDTLEDTNNLGAGHKYWSFLPKESTSKNTRRISLSGMENLGCSINDTE